MAAKTDIFVDCLVSKTRGDVGNISILCCSNVSGVSGAEFGTGLSQRSVGSDVCNQSNLNAGCGPGDSCCAAPGLTDDDCKFFGDPPPRARVFHVIGIRPVYVVGGVEVESFGCVHSRQI